MSQINTFSDSDCQRIGNVVRRVETTINVPFERRPHVLVDIGNARFLTPVGGIPARTGTGPWTPGVATCTLCEAYTDSGTRKFRTTTITQQVYNDVPDPVGASLIVQAKQIDGDWVVDMEPC